MSASTCRYQKVWVCAQTVGMGYYTSGAGNNHETPLHGCRPTPSPHCSTAAAHSHRFIVRPPPSNDVQCTHLERYRLAHYEGRHCRHERPQRNRVHLPLRLHHSPHLAVLQKPPSSTPRTHSHGSYRKTPWSPKAQGAKSGPCGASLGPHRL